MIPYLTASCDFNGCFEVIRFDEIIEKSKVEKNDVRYVFDSQVEL